MASKRTRALKFPPEVRERIKERDGGCIFCLYQMKYQINPCPPTDIMHIVPRSQGGLGIEQNGVYGCRLHHEMMDNGSHGEREEMQSYITWYMMERYPGWDRKNLVYRKDWT